MILNIDRKKHMWNIKLYYQDCTDIRM